jgi:hypothetical protein
MVKVGSRFLIIFLVELKDNVEHGFVNLKQKKILYFLNEKLLRLLDPRYPMDYLPLHE